MHGAGYGWQQGRRLADLEEGEDEEGEGEKWEPAEYDRDEGDEGDEGESTGKRRANIRRWQETAESASFMRTFEMLDELERSALADLQLELAALLAERSQLQEARTQDALARWCAQLDGMRRQGSFTGALSAEAVAADDEAAAESRELLFENLRSLISVRSAMRAYRHCAVYSHRLGLFFLRAE